MKIDKNQIKRIKYAFHGDQLVPIEQNLLNSFDRANSAAQYLSNILGAHDIKKPTKKITKNVELAILEMLRAFEHLAAAGSISGITVGGRKFAITPKAKK